MVFEKFADASPCTHPEWYRHEEPEVDCIWDVELLLAWLHLEQSLWQLMHGPGGLHQVVLLHQAPPQAVCCPGIYHNIEWNLVIMKPLGPWKSPCYIRFLVILGFKKRRNIKSWDQQNYLVISGLCYISELFYNELPLYYIIIHHKSYTKWLIEGAIWTV